MSFIELKEWSGPCTDLPGPVAQRPSLAVGVPLGSWDPAPLLAYGA